jgi:hypothetical protein
MAITRLLLDCINRIRRNTGKQYPQLEKELEALSVSAQQELLRLIVDLEHEKEKAARNAALQPWKRW